MCKYVLISCTLEISWVVQSQSSGGKKAKRILMNGIKTLSKETGKKAAPLARWNCLSFTLVLSYPRLNYIFNLLMGHGDN